MKEKKKEEEKKNKMEKEKKKKIKTAPIWNRRQQKKHDGWHSSTCTYPNLRKITRLEKTEVAEVKKDVKKTMKSEKIFSSFQVLRHV